jgi:hypothetical protein
LVASLWVDSPMPTGIGSLLYLVERPSFSFSDRFHLPVSRCSVAAHAAFLCDRFLVEDHLVALNPETCLRDAAQDPPDAFPFLLVRVLFVTKPLLDDPIEPWGFAVSAVPLEVGEVAWGPLFACPVADHDLPACLGARAVPEDMLERLLLPGALLQLSAAVIVLAVAAVVEKVELPHGDTITDPHLVLRELVGNRGPPIQ